MKKSIIFFVIALTIFSKSLNAQVSDNYALTPSDLIIQSNGEYDIIEVIDHAFTDEIGSPQLPVKIVSYVLPYNSTVLDVQVNSVTQQKLQGSYYIYPAQLPIRLDGSEPPAFVEPNQAVYDSSEPYPNRTVEIINDGYTHGYHVVTVAIYPVVYYPMDREIYLQDISFTINHNNTFDSSKGIHFERQSSRRAELGKQFVQSMVKNAHDVANFKNSNAQIIDYSNNININT